MKQTILNNLKNIWGWKTNRKILVLSIDDYGNVRVDSKKARENMDRAGLKIFSRFDVLDSMETREDLEVLFNTLTAVKDKKNKNAVITAFAMPCNIDFERIAAENNSNYYYELLPETFKKLSGKDPMAYEGTWKLWNEGINKGLIIPQYHGREHLNIKVFEEKLMNTDYEVLTAMKNRSYTSITDSGYKTINYNAAFDFWDPIENLRLKEILVDGIDQFRKVFGLSPVHFMPPTSKIDRSHFTLLRDKGIKYVDTNLFHKQHKGFGKYKISINFTGKETGTGLLSIVRNVVFEPTSDNNIDWVNYAFKQIEAAFRWNRPAIVSSHRVNFCGYIDPNNRKIGIDSLRKLLKKVLTKWPDVEFMSANELGDLIRKT